MFVCYLYTHYWISIAWLGKVKIICLQTIKEIKYIPASTLLHITNCKWKAMEIFFLNPHYLKS